MHTMNEWIINCELFFCANSFPVWAFVAAIVVVILLFLSDSRIVFFSQMSLILIWANVPMDEDGS